MLSHADRIGLLYEAFPSERQGQKSRALVLHPLHVDELRDWFERSAVLGRSLKHPSLVEVHALGYTANQLPVVVTEWTDGQTLRSRIGGGEVIPVMEIRRVIDQVAAALDYLHGRGTPVLHRVIMPETVLISPRPLPVKLLSVGHADRPLHPASKPSYLSPEELDGHSELTPAADIFSLATLAFEAITGRIAFPGPTAAAVLSAMQRRQLPYIALAPQEGLQPLDDFLHRAWAMDPSRRAATAGEFAMELTEAIKQVPGALLASRRTVRDGVLRARTMPPIAGAMGRQGAMRSQTPVPHTPWASTRPPPMVVRLPSSRPLSSLPGPAGNPPRMNSGPPSQQRAAGVDFPVGNRRADEDVHDRLSLNKPDRDARPWADMQEILPLTSRKPLISVLGTSDEDDAEITLVPVDIDDPEVLALLSEDFTSPVIPPLVPRVPVDRKVPQFEGDFADHPVPIAPTRPPNRLPSAAGSPAHSGLPSPMRAQTQPSGFPSAMQQRVLTSLRNDRPPEFDPSPVSRFDRPDLRVRDAPTASVLPWHSRELKVTPWIIAVVLSLNLVLTGALGVVLRHFLL